MRPRRAFCVSRDDGVRRVVGAALTASGLALEHLEALPEPATVDDDVVVIVVDRATRQAAGEILRRFRAPVVVVGDDLDDDALITLMLEAPVSHLVRDPADRDLGITSEKLATGDVFGLEKYLAPGARVAERVVRSDLEKRRAMDEVCAWAEAIGARKPVLHRLASVVDELLMNALRDPGGDPPAHPSGVQRARSTGLHQPHAVLRWASDATSLAISVGDGFGSLRQRDVIDNVRRARSERGRPQIVSASGGAGLGLYLVLANVASLIVNVLPGKQTEVVCLFDLSRKAHEPNLHVFQGTLAT